MKLKLRDTMPLTETRGELDIGHPGCFTLQLESHIAHQHMEPITKKLTIGLPYYGTADHWEGSGTTTSYLYFADPDLAGLAEHYGPVNAARFAGFSERMPALKARLQIPENQQNGGKLALAAMVVGRVVNRGLATRDEGAACLQEGPFGLTEADAGALVDNTVRIAQATISQRNYRETAIERLKRRMNIGASSGAAL